MNIPLTISDISLWLAATAIILLSTSELLSSSQEYSIRIYINKTRMRIAGVGCGIAFLITFLLGFI